MTTYSKLLEAFPANSNTWLYTGVAGFIGFNLLQAPLELNQIIVRLDSLSTGHQHNLDEVQASLDEDKWSRFTSIECDLCDNHACREACAGVDYLS
jgi:UDP-N-acetylglucosamine 4-epimerase